MDFERSAPIAGDGGKALGFAHTVLAQANFRVVDQGERTAEFEGPRMMSSRQNPLNGARRVKVTVRGGKLTLEADLQGVGWLFVVIGAVLVLIGLALTVVMLLSDTDASPAILILPLGIWVILLPIMYWWTRRIVVSAYETLLLNMLAAEKRK